MLKSLAKLETINDDFYDILINNITEEERINMIKILNKCKCCKKHNKNKPTIKQYLNGYVPHYSLTNNLNNLKCNCSCRHYIRHICRAKNDEIIDF